jgi:rare lipoprotein A
MTCAHRSLPFGTRVRVTNLSNKRSAGLSVNDRGPFVNGRIVDVSTDAADVLGFRHAGLAQVMVETLPN